MISDPHDHPDHLDETASALLDQQLEDDEHTFAQTDPLVRDRARTFASLRASLLDTSTDDQLEVTPAGGARSADRQIMAALDVFDQLFPAAGSPSATDTRLTAPAPSPASAAAPPLAAVSLEAHRARRARSRTMMAVLGVAAAIAVVVFGVSRFSGEDESKSLSSAQTTALPAIAGAAQTAPAKRSTDATNASSAVSEAAGGTTGVVAAGSQIPAPAAAAADGSATAAATSPIDQGSVLPQLESTDQLVTYIVRSPSFTATSIAAASAGTTAGGAALPSSAAGTAAATTAASATTAAASASTTAGTTAGTAGTRGGAVCDPSPSAVFIGTILWQGQRATVFATPAPDGSPHRVGTVYSASCAVLTQVDIPF